MTAVLPGLTQPIEQETLLHRKPTSRTAGRVLTALAMLVLSDRKQEIVEEYDHVKR